MIIQASLNKVFASASQAPLLAVTGSQPPYIFDLPHLLSLPKGFEFRFRYRHRWVDDQIVREIVDDREALAGRELVVLFHSQDSKRLIPVRRGVVIGIESVGPMIFLRFRVGDFPKVAIAIENSSGSTPSKTSALDSLGNLATGLIGRIGDGQEHDLGEELPKGFYLRQAMQLLNPDDWTNEDDSKAWARLAAVLHDEPNFGGIPLFYLLGFKSESGASISPSAIANRFSPSREEIHGFSLVESERYRLRMIAWREPKKGTRQPPFKVLSEFNPDRLRLEGASDLVVGRYDVIEFTFAACASGYSEIGLRAELSTTQVEDDKNDGEQNSASPPWATWPSIFVARVPVAVRRRTRGVVLAAISTLVGAGLYVFAGTLTEDQVKTWFEGTLTEDQLKTWIQLLSLAFLVPGWRELSSFVGDIFTLSAVTKKLRGGPESWSS